MCEAGKIERRKDKVGKREEGPDTAEEVVVDAVRGESIVIGAIIGVDDVGYKAEDNEGEDSLDGT